MRFFLLYQGIVKNRNNLERNTEKRWWGKGRAKKLNYLNVRMKKKKLKKAERVKKGKRRAKDYETKYKVLQYHYG